jgi:DNA polymerase delta subunit 2
MAPEASDMMRAPDAEMAPAQTLERAVKAYSHRDDRFALDKKIYGQYFQLYYQRLMLLLPRLKLAVEAKWPGAATAKILDLKEGEECVIMGTLYKDMRLKPSILDEYGKDLTLGATVDAKKFVADDDALVLEDEGARVKLVGAAADPKQFVTGVVMACRGKVVQDGEFEVSETCFPAPAPQKPFPVAEKDEAPASASSPPPGEYVALVSGLRVGDPRASDPKVLELLLDYLTGNLGSSVDQRAAASVARVIIAGGALAEPEDRASLSRVGGAGQTASSIQNAANARAQLRSLDVFLTQLAASVPVDVMPGEGDPTNQALPQQPLHPCLFPEASRFAPATFAAATNPHDFSVGACDFLGTSGQNIDNMRAYMDLEASRRSSGGEDDSLEDASAASEIKTNLAKKSGAESLDLLASSLRWQHVAPSAPDTLACYPYKDRDPFYVDKSPHVYFAGNQPAFGARVVRSDGETKTLLVSVPDFAKTGVVAMVNVDTLECFPAQFGA